MPWIHSKSYIINFKLYLALTNVFYENFIFLILFIKNVFELRIRKL